MSTQHPITPPPEMVASLRNSAPHHLQAARETWLITHAYSAGADMRLEVMLAKLEELHLPSGYAEWLRALCRPKLPSDKEQGLEALDRMDQLPTTEDKSTILAALEALHDD